MARKLLLVYLAAVFGPLLLAALAFALRDRLRRWQPRPHPRSNGHARDRRLADTVEEARAP